MRGPAEFCRTDQERGKRRRTGSGQVARRINDDQVWVDQRDPLQRQLEQALAANQRHKRLGKVVATERPKPGARTTAEDDGGNLDHRLVMEGGGSELNTVGISDRNGGLIEPRIGGVGLAPLHAKICQLAPEND